MMLLSVEGIKKVYKAGIISNMIKNGNDELPVGKIYKSLTSVNESTNALHLVEHYNNYQDVLVSLSKTTHHSDAHNSLREDIYTLFNQPFDPTRRAEYYQSIMNTENPVEESVTQYLNVLNTDFPTPHIQNSIATYLAQNPNTEVNMLMVAPNEIPLIQNHPSLPSILHALKPFFKSLTGQTIEFLLQFVNLHEKFALVLFEPIFISIVGVVTFTSVALTLHLPGAFKILIEELFKTKP